MRFTTIIIWVSFVTVALGQTADQGRFGRALKPTDTYAAAPANRLYMGLPMTVECWAKLSSKAEFNVLVANEPKSSVTHWEIFAGKDSGVFSAFLPGYKPAEIKSTRDIVDGQWHYVAMTFDGVTVRLLVDAQEVANQKVEKAGGYTDIGPLAFGRVAGVAGAPDLLLDEVRISRVQRAVDKVPEAAFTADADTVGLWHFDEDGKSGFKDFSTAHNDAALTKGEPVLSPVGGEQKTKWTEMECGPFFSSTIVPAFPKGNVVNKAISIRLGKERDVTVCFDTELLRVAAGWTGGFVKIHPNRDGLAQHPDPVGTIKFGTTTSPGWAKGEDFKDPRTDNLGPLPADWAKYEGLYLHGDKVILSYKVGGVGVLEMHDVEAREGTELFTRTLEVAAAKTNLTMLICEVPEPQGKEETNIVALEKDGAITAVGVVGAPAEASLHIAGGSRIQLTLPPHQRPLRCKVVLWTGKRDELQRFQSLLRGVSRVENLAALTKGGPPRWNEPLFTRGEVGKDDAPYTVDTLTAPEDNPWKSFLRFSGFDFFNAGGAAICSISGDVWVVTGLGAGLEKITWRRFATGLFQPLGLKIVNDTVYVLGRDQITRLQDLNGDGEADFYENFNNDCLVTPGGHEYTTGLETDPRGNFYYTKCGNPTGHGGTFVRVSADGNKFEVIATGLRNPNGMGVSPEGVLTVADNEGDWVPSSRIDIVTKNAFLGFVPMAHTNPPPTHPGYPLCWIPHSADNSSGGQTWVTSDKWGAFKGDMLHTSYGSCSLFHVLQETVNGRAQGGVYKFPLTFASGIMRARFRPKDGALYVCGLRGWQTSGVKDGIFQRVRYTGKPVCLPATLNIYHNGIRLGFTCELNPKDATDTESYTVSQWNYHWSGEYGSKDWSVADPTKQGHDTLTVKSARLSQDRKSVFLEIPGLAPVMQMQIHYDLKAADGTKMRDNVYNTIHELRPDAPPDSLDRPAAQSSVTSQPSASPGADKASRKIVLIAGKLDDHPRGTHEYEKTVKLLKQCLETSPNLSGISAETHFNGWPADATTLDDADTIVVVSGGADRNESDHPLLVGDRLEKIEKQMKRGCGLVAIHWTTFFPNRIGEKIFDWIGGYFDYQSGPPPGKWASKIQTVKTIAKPGTPDHPICRGLEPYELNEEYYYRIRFRENDARLKPILVTSIPGEPQEQTVAWAVARADGGRGFGFTGGHFWSNWSLPMFRKMVLNAIVWTAKADVPAEGVKSDLANGEF